MTVYGRRRQHTHVIAHEGVLCAHVALECGCIESKVVVRRRILVTSPWLGGTGSQNHGQRAPRVGDVQPPSLGPSRARKVPRVARQARVR